MKIYFVRHAPTSANVSGAMVAGYENSDINLLDKPDEWEEKVGAFIPDVARRVILSSPTRRCISTAKLLFDRAPDEVTYDLGEFDCKNLGHRKFWEINEFEFNNLVFLPASTMQRRAEAILGHVANNVRHENGTDSFVAVSHGMVIRYIYHFVNGNPGISAYDIINSRGFRFSNLDLLVVDTEAMTAEPHHFTEPIQHG